MRKVYDVPQTPPDNPEVEYYKELARLSEERARETRRIAALERARLEEALLEQEPTLKAFAGELERLSKNCESLRTKAERVKESSHRLKKELAVTKAQFKTLKRAQARIAGSRAHRLADAYVRHASGSSLLARTVRSVRPIVRVLNRIRRKVMSR
jgi:chromosome segregation ATPase